MKYKTLTQKGLPKQPSEMNDTQWDVVKRMCAWKPDDRISLSEAVESLAELASAEFYLKTEVEWAEHKASKHILEPELAVL